MELKLLGTHNYENVMAAVAIAAAMGVPLDAISVRQCINFTGRGAPDRICGREERRRLLQRFQGHESGCVRSRAIQAMDRPTIVIGGGYDKHVTFVRRMDRVL